MGRRNDDRGAVRQAYLGSADHRRDAPRIRATLLFRPFRAYPGWVPEQTNRLPWPLGQTAAPTTKDIGQQISESSRYIVGDPDTVVRKLRDYHDDGYKHVIGLFNSGTKLTLETVRSNMELFSREVLPKVKDW